MTPMIFYSILQNASAMQAEPVLQYQSISAPSILALPSIQRLEGWKDVIIVCW
jgi:hypothetical protein